MIRINEVRVPLKCNSLNDLLKPERNLNLDGEIAQAKLEYRLKYGAGLGFVTSFTSNNGIVTMILYQKPPEKLEKVNLRTMRI